MATGTPVWTQNVSVVTAQVLARGATVRGTLDLRTKWGARVFARLGRGGATAIASSGGTAGVDLLIRALDNNGAAGTEHPGAVASRLSQTAAAAITTVSTTSNSGQAVLTVTNTSGFAAGNLVCIQDAGGGVTRLEFHRVSLITGGAGGTLTMDRPLGFTHTSGQVDTVRNMAEAYPPIWIAGGTLYEMVWDYGDDTAGDSVTVVTTAQTYDSDSLA